MQLEVLQKNLDKALSLASRFTAVKAQLPVLGNLLFSAKKTRLTISATNLEISLAVSLGARVIQEGTLTLPARVIADLITNLSEGTVNLKSDKEHLLISSAGFASKVLGMNSGDFPTIPQTMVKEESLIFPKDLFLEALTQVSFSTSIDETRPILTGVLFIFESGQLCLVATDGFRLSQKKIKLASSLKSKKVVLPKSALAELARIGENEESLRFLFKEKENQVLFGVENLVLSSRILEGDFPPFEKIIPKSSKIKVRVDKEEFLRAVKLASIFARDSANVVKISLGKDSLRVFAESSTAGNQETKIEAVVDPAPPEASRGEGFEIAFNYRFLEDFLRVVKGEEVNLAFSDSASPGVFTDPKDPEYLHLIMPVKLQG
jgi:DNA polymerase-3 subunit beta